MRWTPEADAKLLEAVEAMTFCRETYASQKCTPEWWCAVAFKSGLPTTGEGARKREQKLRAEKSEASKYEADHVAEAKRHAENRDVSRLFALTPPNETQLDRIERMLRELLERVA